MDEINKPNASSVTDDRREEIKQKLRQYYDGRIVRKDLTKQSRKGQMFRFMYWNIYSVSIAIRMMRRLFKRDWIM